MALPTWTSEHNTTIDLNRLIHNRISEIQGNHDEGLLEIITSKINFLQQYARIIIIIIIYNIYRALISNGPKDIEKNSEY